MGKRRTTEISHPDAARSARRDEKLVRSTHWHGLVPGDLVKVRGERGARFVYRCHVLNRESGSCWVELDELAHAPQLDASRPTPATGNRPVVRRQRSIDVERIVRLPRPRRRPEPAQGVQESFDLSVGPGTNTA